jgi:hypothetical protein
MLGTPRGLPYRSSESWFFLGMGASSQRSEVGAGVRSKIRVSVLPFLEGEQEIFLNSRVSDRIVKKGTVRTTW